MRMVVRPSRQARVNGSPSKVASENSGAGSPAAMTAMCPGRGSAAQAELADQRAIPLQVLLLEVVEEPSAPADQHEQAAAGVVVVLGLAEMGREVVDATGEERDLPVVA